MKICSVEGCGRRSHDKNGLCVYHDAAQNRKGAKNPRWNGGTSEYPNHGTMKITRRQKLESVNWICESCGGKATEVHHKDKTKTNHSLSNLIAVCHKCHMSKFHKGEERKHTQKFIDKQREIYRQKLPKKLNKIIRLEKRIRILEEKLLKTTTKHRELTLGNIEIK